MIKSLMKKTLLGILALGLSGAVAARADSILTSSFVGGPSLSITYTGSDNLIHTENGAAGPFTATPTNPAGPSFMAFCVSLDIGVGNGPDVIHTSVVAPLSSVGQSFFVHSNFADVGNRLAFILTNDTGTTLENQAAALAVWYTIDKNFAYTGGSTALHNQYLADIAFTGYNPLTMYGGTAAKLFIVDQNLHPYQNLIGLTEQSFVPEPASVVSAVVGLAGMGLFGLRRNRKSVA